MSRELSNFFKRFQDPIENGLLIVREKPREVRIAFRVLLSCDTSEGHGVGEAAILATLGELLGAFRDVTELTKEGVAYFGKRRSEKWADAASMLLFTPRGSRRPLGRIAAGKGTAADFDDLHNALAFSERKVDESISTLTQLDTDDLRKRYGLAAKERLDEILHGEVGKRQTRGLLWEIVGERAGSPYTQQKAQQALENIAALNRLVVELHDLIVLAK